MGVNGWEQPGAPNGANAGGEGKDVNQILSPNTTNGTGIGLPPH